MTPYEIPEMAGKHYSPSNGTEGMMFMAEFCDRCKRDAKYRETDDGKDGCKIIAASMTTKEGAAEWTHDFLGRPTCTAFEEEDSP